MRKNSNIFFPQQIIDALDEVAPYSEGKGERENKILI
jgi:hypothetical protein